MADSFAFNVAQKVLEKLGSFIFREIGLAWGVKSELNKLEATLSTIKAVLLDAEEQRTKNHTLNVWLEKLKDVCYDADDVLDEFEYEALQWQVVNLGGIKRKVCNFFSRSSSLAFRFKMGHKIKEIRERLDEIAADKAKFHLTERVEDWPVMHRERVMTHSFVRASDVIGRDKDKERIIKLLLHPNDGGNVSIIPIVGIGGLGKTTLAKFVYNDGSIVRNFELKMWVCVSQDFDVTKLTKEIIKSATGKNCDDLTIDQLQTCLRSTLDNKKFLLILDDVWNEDRSKWIELRDLILGGANGSKIVVTTRSSLVASIMGTIPAYNLKGLPHEDCLSLFVRCAFKEGEEKQYPNLLEIGDGIVKKCSGVPLAVKTLGSLLYSKRNVRDWLSIKDNEIWKIEQKENDILPALRLSYDIMPPYLKQCFAFCSIFPQDYRFNNVKLIQLWIAQGFLQSSNENQELEDIGQQYIQELLSRSFFQDVDQKWPLDFGFEMHDLIHDLALSVAQSDCSIINFHSKNISKKVRHLSFSNNDFPEEADPRLVLPLNNLRTILFPVRVGQSFLETCISRLKYLRVLDLRRSSFEVLPSSIGNLKHLRYLDLSENRTIKRLPNSICKLQNLQTLNLKECDKLEELPTDMGNMISLRNFYITTKEMLLPEEGIKRLVSLRSLWIECDNLKSLGEGIFQSPTALRTLVIRYCNNLKSLPHTMKCLTMLGTLLISNCDSLQESLLSSMKYLTALETLIIENCEKLNLMEWEEDIQGLRLSLQSLWISSLPQLVALPQWLQWSANTLQHIHIEDCDNLRTLPEWLQNLRSLQKLEILNCSKLSALPEGMHQLTTLRELTIEFCPELSRRCRQEDWPKIAHVPEIYLDKETSDEEETIDEVETSESSNG